MTELPPGADRPPWRAGACARTPADGAAGGARACARDQPTDTRWTPLPTGLLDALFTRGGVASPHRSKPKGETHVGEQIAEETGKLLEGGAVSYRGASYYYSDSPNFRRLNAVAVVFEYSADADGNTKSKAWEWK